MKISDQLKTMSRRLKLSDAEMAKYLGVPITTYNKWTKGERVPNASVIRLIEVLDLIEVFCPTLTLELIK